MSDTTGLKMDGLTHARSISGSKLLKNDFSESIEGLIRVLNGDKYTTFKKTIAANWVGADATDFLNDIDKTRADLEKTLRNLKNKFTTAVDADLKQFANFQSKNVK